MSSATPGLQLPIYASHHKCPVKMVETPGGGMRAWRLSRWSGRWEPADDLVDDILFARDGETTVLSVEDFIFRVEAMRTKYLSGEGPVFALYETVKAIMARQDEENRVLSPTENAIVDGIWRRTFRMFEEMLVAEGDPGADPDPVPSPRHR